MPDSEYRFSQWLVAGLIILGVASRLVPHPWNATPLMAIALFGGTYLARKWAILLPLAIMIVSDAFIGWHNTVVFTWFAFVLTGMIAWWLRIRPRAARILTGAVMGSALFFLITNFGVWAMWNMYPHTAAGLLQCYIAAIPFFRSALLGDLIYTAAFFGLYALATRRILAHENVTAA